MKVGIDVSQVVFGSGVSDYTQCLVNHLPQDILHPFAFTRNSAEKIKSLIPSAQILPIPLSIMEFLGNTIHRTKIESVIKDLDIYHSSDWIEFPTTIKKITTIHDLTPFLFPHEIDSKIISVHAKKMKWVVKESDHIICVSQSTANDVMKLFSIPVSKISIIYEALPDRFMIPATSSPYSNYLVAMGSAQPRKNISRLVSSYQKYRTVKKLPNKLIVIGENAIASSDPDIIFTGYIPNQQVVNLVAGAEAFIYPSVYEGFGLPALVSFFHQTPFVASNTSSLPEVIGSAGVLFDPYSEESISDGIVAALKNKKTLISAGTEQLKKFSWAKTATQTHMLYKSLLP